MIQSLKKVEENIHILIFMSHENLSTQEEK